RPGPSCRRAHPPVRALLYHEEKRHRPGLDHHAPDHRGARRLHRGSRRTDRRRRGHHHLTAESPMIATPTSPKPAPAAPLTGTLRIAVADDEADTREYLQEILKRLGHQVMLAQTGRQLAEQCKLVSPDLIITDIKMPDMDGIDAAIAVNRERETPVILI